MNYLQEVLSTYALDYHAGTKVEPYGGGLINDTWCVTDQFGVRYILQRINHQIFKHPQAIADNISLCKEYLDKNHPDYLFIAPLPNVGGQNMTKTVDGSYYRLFPFVEGSHAKSVATSPDQGYEAARQFGRFTHHLEGIDMAQLQVSLPHFHDLALRFQQFVMALQGGNPKRISQAKKWIECGLLHQDIADKYRHLTAK